MSTLIVDVFEDKISPSIEKTIKLSIDKRLDDIDVAVASNTEDISKINNKVEDIMQKLKDRPTDGNPSVGSTPLTANLVDRLANESVLRMRKACNIILYNIPESTGPDVASWDWHDLSSVLAALKPIKFYRNNQIRCSRIGEYNYNEMRPLRVTLPQPMDVFIILKHKYKLLNGVDAKQDLTTLQIEQ